MGNTESAPQLTDPEDVPWDADVEATISARFQNAFAEFSETCCEVREDRFVPTRLLQGAFCSFLNRCAAYRDDYALWSQHVDNPTVAAIRAAAPELAVDGVADFPVYVGISLERWPNELF